VKVSNFEAMVDELREELDRSGKCGGQNRLSVEEQLLLQYWWEYRTQFRIGLDFGVSEATVDALPRTHVNLSLKTCQFCCFWQKAVKVKSLKAF
jgi:hypothetical protein